MNKNHLPTLVGVFLLSLCQLVQAKSVIDGPKPIISQAINEPPLCTKNSPAPQTQITVIAEATGFLRSPRDLAFSRKIPNQLWVVNGADDSIAIIHAVDSATPSIEYRQDHGSSHFMHHPSAIAFGGMDTTIVEKGTFATSQESINESIRELPLLKRLRRFLFKNENLYFMGPTLFSSSLAVFAKSADKRSSHLDMLHESPLAMGIAWEKDNIYWVFGGHYSDIVQYNFNKDHSPGNSDHADGTIRHYLSGQVKRVAQVPSHLAFDHASNMLFVADTGHSRVLKLDIASGKLAADFQPPASEQGVDSKFVVNAVVEEFVPKSQGIQQPSGLEVSIDWVFVSDHASGKIFSFHKNGMLHKIIDTGIGSDSLMGLALGPDDKLYFVDSKANRILRVECF